MREYLTDAVVLDRYNTGDADARIILFTEKFGKVVVRARSIRKITSKLSSHLQPLSLVTVRLVFSKSVQIVDALKKKNFLVNIREPMAAAEMIELGRLVAEATERDHADVELWQLLSSGVFTGRSILRSLGFDPDHAKCEVCGKSNPERFVLRRASYACARCLPTLVRSREYYALHGAVVK